GYHYYTQLLQAQALESGAEWLESSGEHASARAARVAAAQTLGLLDGFWSGDGHYYRSRSAGQSADSRRNPDIAVIIAALHAGRDGDRHGVLDPKVQATLTALEELFEAEYPINRERPPGRGPALGRYANDRYYGGGAWFLSTLAAAEFY